MEPVWRGGGSVVYKEVKTTILLLRLSTYTEASTDADELSLLRQSRSKSTHGGTESPRIGKNRHVVLTTFSPVSVPDNISNFHVMVS